MKSNPKKHTHHSQILIEVPNLDTVGFGIDGNLTRRQWQNLCFEKLQQGPQMFREWQTSLLETSEDHLPTINFNLRVKDYKENDVTDFYWRGQQTNFILDYTNRTFENILFLDNYEFLVGVLFCGCNFKAPVSFNNNHFYELAHFDGSNFDTASFVDAYFHKSVFFDDATIKSWYGLGATFLLHASFRRVEFKEAAFFQESKINFGSFENAFFGGPADFSGNTTKNNNSLQRFNQMRFEGSIFNRSADFSNRVFDGLTSFGMYEKAPTIFKEVPLFHNSVLHQDTTFEGAIFPNPDNFDQRDARAYNTLRLAMNKNQHLMAEKIFTKYVLESERVLTSGFENGVFTFYKVVSNYGFSLLRPFLYLLVLPIILLGFCYSAIESADETCMIWNEGCSINKELLLNGFKFSTLQSLPFGLDKTSEALMRDYFPISRSSFKFITLILIQKVLSLIGWFLIGLALRNLFKIK